MVQLSFSTPADGGTTSCNRPRDSVGIIQYSNLNRDLSIPEERQHGSAKNGQQTFVLEAKAKPEAASEILL